MATGATPASSSSSDSERLNAVGILFGQYFGLLFAMIGFQIKSVVTTSKEITEQIKALALVCTLYYMVWMVVTWYQLQVPLMMVTSPLLGTVVVFIGLMIVSHMVAFIYLGLLIFVFALKVLCNKYPKEIYEMIPENIKYLFERPAGNENVGSSAHDLESGRVESVAGY
ncbi:unnamed protein product [Vicia faba]|uniref:Uncharacterized protein n=1 Tax=Vicia faba TaxID=3906 RepID=A0AAV0Z2L0_VICFA|nr:unnamed protein product [Vicia faba]